MTARRIAVRTLVSLSLLLLAWDGFAQPNTCLDCTPSEAGLLAGARNRAQCDPNQLCVAVRDCIVESQCHDSFVSCYCGDGVSTAACANPSFVPLGPCAAEIQAGGHGGVTRTQTIQSLIVPEETPTGVAVSVVAELAEDGSLCVLDCYDQLVPTVPFLPPAGVAGIAGMLVWACARRLTARRQ